jgi:hypothetical protein
MRRVLGLILVVLLVFQGPAGAQTSDSDIQHLPGGVGLTGSEKDKSAPKGTVPKPVPKPVCPNYEETFSVPSQGPQPGENGTTWAWKQWRCPPEGWQQSPVCISGPCPEGVTAIPPPPSDEEVHKALVKFALKPIGRFAPPVENPDVKAIVGMRFYFSVDPSSYQTLTPEPLVFPGGWSIAATLTPGDIEFTSDPTGSKVCKGPGASGTTKAGREADDYEGCFVVFETVPDSGRLDITMTTHWHIVVIRTNFRPGVREWDDVTVESTSMGLRELQAVVEG